MDYTWNVMPVYGVSTWVIVMLVVIVLLIAALVALSIYGKKLQDRQEDSQRQLQEAAQSAKLLVIDKKKMKFKDSGLPPMVLEQVPKYMRGRKVPIVKAKIGPRIMSLICEDKIFDLIPVKKEIRATISGIYIMDVKGLHNNLEHAPKGKKKLGERMRERAEKKSKELNQKRAELEKDNKKKNKYDFKHGTCKVCNVLCRFFCFKSAGFAFLQYRKMLVT